MTERSKPGMATRIVFYAILFWVVLGGLFYGLNLHIVHKPTADELFGCTPRNLTPDGECK